MAKDAHRVNGEWPSLFHVRQVEEQGLEDFCRLVVERHPDRNFGTRRLNVSKVIRELLDDGYMLFQYAPNWQEACLYPVLGYEGKKGWLPDIWSGTEKELDPGQPIPLTASFGYFEAKHWRTGGLCLKQRKNMPRWYCIRGTGEELHEVGVRLVRCLSRSS